MLFSFRPVFLQIVFFSALSASCPSVLPCFAFVPLVLYLFARLPAYVSRDPPAALFVLILHPPYTRARVAQISGVGLDGSRVAFRLGGLVVNMSPCPAAVVALPGVPRARWLPVAPVQFAPACRVSPRAAVHLLPSVMLCKFLFPLLSCFALPLSAFRFLLPALPDPAPACPCR